MPKKCVCGSAPDPAGGAYSVPPDPLAGNGGGATLKGTVGRGEETRVGRGGNGRRERGRGGEREGKTKNRLRNTFTTGSYLFRR